MAARTAPKLRILCLHGYGQSRNSFCYQLRYLRRELRQFVDFVIPSQGSFHSGETPENRCWWPSRKEAALTGEPEHRPELLVDVIEEIREAIQAMGPIDGLLGFHQGACLATLVLQCAKAKLFGFETVDFKLAILVNGYRYEATHSFFEREKLWPPLIDVPTMHVFAAEDPLVPPHQSIILNRTFVNLITCPNANGHKLPLEEFVNLEIRVFVYKRWMSQTEAKHITPWGRNTLPIENFL